MEWKEWGLCNSLVVGGKISLHCGLVISRGSFRGREEGGGVLLDGKSWIGCCCDEWIVGWDDLRLGMMIRGGDV